MAPPSALPRRPLTVGELLDAAAQLVRNRAVILLPVAALFAIAEQAILYPLRVALGVDFLNGFDDGFWETMGALWVVMAIGCGLEAMIITFLGTRTGVLAAQDLAATPAAPRALLRPRWRDAGALTIAAPAAAVCTAIGAFLGPLWVLGYGLFGMAGAAMGLERRGAFRGLGRAAGMAFRNGMRAIWVRTLGYAAWLLLRLGFFIGMLALFDQLPLTDTAQAWSITAGFVIANSAAYLYLAALDAAALAEGRFRSEGLDIWLSRAQRHAPLTPESVVASR
ncbi:hypothetical protein Rhe02_51300 [Rhizocola hellebori]|uniref:Uncharacterized protein n=1 Tax=Rhizocola hellebori TaxID=1392758 RepID=A0A8J3VIL8_9ACTN|nr:hypothetical protein [Rhizocola hellebori]GIH07063.1 hypothetical protein Rhe02_51300 [Rhizocola hellebori]